MSFNISAFKSAGLVYGGSRPSLFNVSLRVPDGIGIDTESQAKFMLVCNAAELPAATVQPIEVGYFGRKIKVAGDRTYADWNVNIMNDEDFSVRSLFEAWNNGLNRFVSNIRDRVLSQEQYKVDLDIVKFSKDGSITRSYKMVGAWPAEIGAIQQSWNDQNIIEEFEVKWCYDYWQPEYESGINKYKNATELTS